MIFHKWKTVFVGIPKNASNTFHVALSNATDSFLPNHDTIFEIYRKHDEELLISYTSFCVCRNPYDRFYSAWKHNHPHPGPVSIEEYRNSFNQFVEKIGVPSKTLHSEINHEHYFSQYKFVTLNKHVLVDKVIRFESLPQGWKDYQDEFNQKNVVPYKMSLTLTQENSSKIKTPWRDVYNKKSKEIISELYHLDFEIFGYDKELLG